MRTGNKAFVPRQLKAANRSLEGKVEAIRRIYGKKNLEEDISKKSLLLRLFGRFLNFF